MLSGLLFFVTLATAQPVYESRDRAGPVFSDMPSQGSREVHLPPVNVIDAPAAAASPASPPAAAAYARVQITEPEDGGTVHSNTGQFSIALILDPPLQPGRGDAIAVRLDGTVLPDRRTTLQFDLTTDEWQMAARDAVEHTLEVAVVDRAGKALLVAAPVRFYVHRASRHD
ncbi:hypothetical protein [Accumulibacter sp.]|uniref:hypothetical protein n=1 Tax=Accumulibacter sp. TaxID=2053492 RepID=UPI0025DA7F5E|nr:hypothetical protein [Accumulibacter sp.]MCM8611353.1 hypothetical protein [Accumulibacter sp.]MCM8635000.1 hypothetical protein [Accumulibacter sp.]MCM8639788.1 hypothetical protein [Accumulibacter sp.]